MSKCKICNNELIKEWQDIYCSNTCKFSDAELNAKRSRKEKNDFTKLLKCTLCEYTTKDILNLGGHAKKHLIQNHNIHESNYIDYYKEIDKPIIEMWKCPECEWKTKDLKNVSGWITSHIIKTHNIEMQDFLIKYPEYLELFNKQSNIIKRNYSLLESNIECKICGMKFYKLSQTHLQKHGITPTEYKIKFGIKNTASQKTSKLQTEKSNDPKIKSKIIPRTFPFLNKYEFNILLPPFSIIL